MSLVHSAKKTEVDNLSNFAILVKLKGVSYAWTTVKLKDSNTIFTEKNSSHHLE